MKDFLEAVLFLALVIGSLVLTIWLIATIYGAIWNSDMPMWLKWLLLR